MTREKYEALLRTVQKGALLKGFEVLPRPADRPGYKWVPLYNNDSQAIGWEEVIDYNYTPSSTGTYTDPIYYNDGMEVIAFQWYTDGDNIWEAVKSGVPAGFDDIEYFDIIM